MTCHRGNPWSAKYQFHYFHKTSTSPRREVLHLDLRFLGYFFCLAISQPVSALAQHRPPDVGPVDGLPGVKGLVEHGGADAGQHPQAHYEEGESNEPLFWQVAEGQVVLGAVLPDGKI